MENRPPELHRHVRERRHAVTGIDLRSLPRTSVRPANDVRQIHGVHRADREIFDIVRQRIDVFAVVDIDAEGILIQRDLGNALVDRVASSQRPFRAVHRLPRLNKSHSC